MKKIKGLSLAIAVFILVIAAAAVSFFHERNKGRMEFADYLISQHGRWATPDSVNELKAAIAANERRIERHVQYASRNATYWKLLSVRLQQRGLHGEALEALEQAISISPEDPLLHYYTGVSAGIMAKSFHLFPGRDNSERNSYYALAESALLRAIELDGSYLRPRYSLGVLYVFDLDRPEDAVPHLQRYLEISRNDVDTMFVLARAFFMMRRFQDSVNLYERIITLSGDEQKRTDAHNNKLAALGHVNG